MVFVRPEDPLRENKNPGLRSMAPGPHRHRIKPASAPAVSMFRTIHDPGRPPDFLSPFSSPVFPRENGHSSGFFRLFACIWPEMMYSIRYIF